MSDETPCADNGFDTWKQLETLLFAQKYWSDQSISTTVYYKKEELEEIKLKVALYCQNVALSRGGLVNINLDYSFVR